MVLNIACEKNATMIVNFFDIKISWGKYYKWNEEKTEVNVSFKRVVLPIMLVYNIGKHVYLSQQLYNKLQEKLKNYGLKINSEKIEVFEHKYKDGQTWPLWDREFKCKQMSCDFILELKVID